MLTKLLFITSLGFSFSSSFAEERAFQEPFILQSVGKDLRVPNPGYIGPTFADIDGDGRLDFVVGKYTDGAIDYYRNTGTDAAGLPLLGEARALMSEGKPISVEGVW